MGKSARAGAPRHEIDKARAIDKLEGKKRMRENRKSEIDGVEKSYNGLSETVNRIEAIIQCA